MIRGLIAFAITAAAWVGVAYLLGEQFGNGDAVLLVSFFGGLVLPTIAFWTAVE